MQQKMILNRLENNNAIPIKNKSNPTKPGFLLYLYTPVVINPVFWLESMPPLQLSPSVAMATINVMIPATERAAPKYLTESCCMMIGSFSSNKIVRNWANAVSTSVITRPTSMKIVFWGLSPLPIWIVFMPCLLCTNILM